MRNEFTAIFEWDDSRLEPCYIAYCIEVPGANAEGKTIEDARTKLAEAEDARTKLAEAIRTALKARREKTIRDFLFDLPADATKEVIAVQETISLY